MFRVQKTRGSARAGVMTLPHGKVPTPAFMPVATKGALRTVTTEQIADTGVDLLLSNTYHLMLQPGVEILKKAGGLHEFMKWNGPILTDSGGFQVFSLSKHVKKGPKGVWFSSPVDGSKHFLSPEKAIQVQAAIGSDIMMVLDQFPGYPAKRKDIEASVHITTRWAERSLKEFKRKRLAKKSNVFAIVQGSTDPEMRERSAKELTAMDFDGFAIGGLAVGEPKKEQYEMIGSTIPFLPADKPRYAMGVGAPEDIIEAVRRGVDMFDCVIPSREARHGRVYAWKKSPVNISFTNPTSRFETYAIKKAVYQGTMKPLSRHCACYTCVNYSQAYVHHLFRVKETVAQTLISIHNLQFWQDLMKGLRVHIKE